MLPWIPRGNSSKSDPASLCWHAGDRVFLLVLGHGKRGAQRIVERSRRAPQNRKSLPGYVNGKRQGPHAENGIGAPHAVLRGVSVLCPCCGRGTLPRPSVPEALLPDCRRGLRSRLPLVDLAAEMSALQKDVYRLSPLSPCGTNSSSAKPCSTKRRSFWGPTSPTGKPSATSTDPWCMTTARTIRWLNEAPRWPTAAYGVGSRGWVA